MPREVKNSLTNRGVLEPISQPTITQVHAAPTDQLEAPMPNYELRGLVDGLAKLNPVLQQYANDSRDAQSKENQGNMLAGAAARQKGEKLKAGSPEYYVYGYQKVDGQVKGDLDGKAVTEGYLTEFDKDAGDLDQWFADKSQELTKGITDKSFLEGYNSSLISHFQKIRAAQNEHHQEQAVQKVESNVMYKVDTLVRSYVDRGEPVPEDQLEQIKSDYRSSLGGTNNRFNDLLFASAKRIGDEGNPAVYEMFKRPTKDGTDGMYYIPAWKEKIDMAQGHAQSTSIANGRASDVNARKVRDEKQSAAILPILQLATTDKTAALVQLDELTGKGMINGADDYFKYRNMITTTGNREESDVAQTAETQLLAGILQGTVGKKQIMGNNTISPGQQRSLLNTLAQQQREARQDAAAGVSAKDAIFKTQTFKSNNDFISRALRPVESLFDIDKAGIELSRKQQAGSLLEFADRASRAKHEDELPGIAQEIVKRGQDRAPILRKDIAGAGMIRYGSIQELERAFRAGNIRDPIELQTHLNYFKSLKEAKPVNATK